MAGLYSRQKDWNDGDILTEADLEAEFDHIYNSVVAGTTSTVGCVQLEDSVTSTSVTKAATPKSVKEAYDHAGGGGLSNIVEDTTPQLGGNLDMNGKSIGGNTEAQIDDAVSKKHTANADTALGAQSENLDMNTHKIVGIVDPAAAQDAATKKYVDDNAGGGGDPSTAIHAAATKATPVDADELGLVDSAASWVLKKLTWANLKATLKTYFDTLYNLYVHPNHSGPVTSAADGATTITDKAVTLAKMNDMATTSLLGRNTAGTGVPEVLSKATTLSLLNVEDGATKYPDTGEQAFLDADHTKLNNIETAADVTDAANIASSTHGVAAKASMVNADEVGLMDSAASWALKKFTLTNLKAFLKTYFDTLYAALAHKTRHQNGGADEINVGGLSGQLADDQHVLDAEVQAVSINNLSEDTTPQLGGQLDVGEYDVKLDSLLSADGKYSGITCDGILGCTASFGKLVYLNETDQRWELADADTEATAGDVQLAIVLAGGVNGNTRLLLLQGFVRENDWNFTSYGHALFVSCTTGYMTATKPSGSGDIVRVIGHASSFADQIYFNPSGTWMEIT